MNKRYILVGLAFLALHTSNQMLAFNPFKSVINVYVKTVGPAHWYFSDFKSLKQEKNRITAVKTLCFLEKTIIQGLKWADEGMPATLLKGIPAVAHAYLLAKTWSPNNTEIIFKKALEPVQMMACTRFACEFDLDGVETFDELIAQSGLPRRQAVKRFYEIALEAIQSCLGWTGRYIEQDEDKWAFPIDIKISI